MRQLKIALAQCNFTVGALEENKQRVLHAYGQALAKETDLVVFSECCVSGYPAEDLVLKPAFQHACMRVVEDIAKSTAGKSTALIIGSPWLEGSKLHNAAFLIERGEIIAKIYKHNLPNYGVFDEKRVYSQGTLSTPVSWRGIQLGIMICEDMWHSDMSQSLKGADILISINASPYEIGKHEKRLERASLQCRALQKPLVYVNQFCGQDDLVFDGDSFVLSHVQELMVRLPRDREAVELTRWEEHHGSWLCEPGTMLRYKTVEEVMYIAMMTGLRDYVHKNGFKDVVLGMSGGIDSALTAAVAADALGPEHVHAVMMPSRFTSRESLEDAEKCARMLGIHYQSISIEPLVEGFENSLKQVFEGHERDVTEENLQSRIRGTLLMALSNKFGHLLLATGNKSEMATGYATLYGDMNGGFSVIKDIYKTQLYEVVEWRNEHMPHVAKGAKGKIIPNRIISKAPSAELRENQKDEDSLPPYETLDMILDYYIEKGWSAEAIIQQGFEKKTVEKIIQLLYKAEYKRRQSPPGVKISVKPFGRDRRYPITNKFV